MSMRRFPIAGLLAVALAFGGVASLGEEASPPPPAEREVPVPLLPGVESLPRGVTPEPWTTWETDQEVDRIPRISIDFSMGSGVFASEPAGSGPDAPTQQEIAGLREVGSLRIGYNLAPSLGLFLAAVTLTRIEKGTLEVQGPTGPQTITIDAAGLIFAGLLGVRVSLPFAHLEDRPFRFSRTVAPTGIAVHFLAAAGFVSLGRLNVGYEGSIPGKTDYNDYWKDSSGPGFPLGIRPEYRWVHFGVFVDFTVAYLGRPEPTSDPLWASRAEAGPIIALVGSLGLSVHF